MIHFRAAEVRIFTVTGKESYSERKLCDGGVVMSLIETTESTTRLIEAVTCPACEAIIRRTLGYFKAIDHNESLASSEVEG